MFLSGMHKAENILDFSVFLQVTFSIPNGIIEGQPLVFRPISKFSGKIKTEYWKYW
jgi:hypothetical protein